MLHKMAGHSKWANIRYRKSLQDSKRGKLFTKYIREITVAARSGGGEPNANPRLRTAVDKALSANMTRDTIYRAIKRGVGGEDGVCLEEIRYEGYGPDGVAVIVDCMTDNRKRTVSEVRHAFSKHGGNLGTDGSVAYLFTQIGEIIFAPGVPEDTLLELALESGAQDVQGDTEVGMVIQTAVEDFHKVKTALEAAKLQPEDAELTMRAQTQITLEGEAVARFIKFLDHIEDLDDVQIVYTNADWTES